MVPPYETPKDLVWYNKLYTVVIGFNALKSSSEIGGWFDSYISTNQGCLNKESNIKRIKVMTFGTKSGDITLVWSQ